jgi:phosphohistidine phosphatase SixA
MKPILALLALLASVAPAQTLFITRHAERAGGMNPSVGISDAGRCRAEALARLLADAGIKRIFATDVARTQQTAEPLARKLAIKTTVRPAKDTAALVEALRASKESALAVGHSDTVPEILRLLGAGAVPPISDTEYDRLYIVTLANGRATAVLLRTPACPAP